MPAVVMPLVALSIWRILIAFEHCASAAAIVDDPSRQELEWGSALLEGGIATLLLVHGAAVLILGRRPIAFSWPFAVSIMLLCSVALSAALLDAPLARVPWVYAATIVTGVAILSRLLPFSWISLYTGAVVGGGVGFVLAAPAFDPLVASFGAAPGVVLAFVGGVLGRTVVPTRCVAMAPALHRGACLGASSGPRQRPGGCLRCT